MKRFACLIALPLAAHTVSLSTGELLVEGLVAQYRLVMPSYELMHVAEPERTLMGAIALGGARLAERHCERDNAAYVCTGKFVFATEPDQIQVTVRLDQAVIGNHVHMLYARRGEAVDQAVFNSSQRTMGLTFEQTGPVERALRTRPLALVVIALTVLTLGCVTRDRWEMLTAIGALMAGLLAPWRLAPWFGEVAVLITASYCTFEAVAVRAGRFRWIAWLALGASFGLYLLAVLPAFAARAAVTVVAAIGAVAVGLVVQHVRTKRA